MTEQLQQPNLIPPAHDQLPDIRSPLFVPRPGWGGRMSNWFKDMLDVKNTLLFLLLLSLIVGANLLVRTKDNRMNQLQNRLNKNLSTPLEITSINIGLTVIRPGQGITHAARSVIRQYTAANGVVLSPEERIYAEDFLRRKINLPEVVFAGLAIQFETNNIKKAIAQAQALPVHSLKNLTQYTKRVKNWDN